MSNGHYTALVDSNRVMHDALEHIAAGGHAATSHIESINKAQWIAREALQLADEISNRNGITQPNNEQENSNVR